ncbi:hypothetical protein B0T20DRAFT_464311 [Sordaria brevicollis]|uniref:Uncharacterized protein n=1 Tax=Sordaria brevicollis TaxID=83679 RepID=A0AAE0P1B2_SORBR|nr:hypothetical protein B0T20DRAFT_464311 [Sordaria brevicollis]
MEDQPLLAQSQPLRLRRRIDIRRIWDMTFPFFIAFYVTSIVVLSIHGVRQARRLLDPEALSGDSNLATLQQVYHSLHCHSQHTTATLLSLTPAGLFGADQFYVGNFLLGLGKILVGAGALICWAAFWTIDKAKYPLWAMDLLSLTGALTVLWFSWGGFDAVIWLMGGVGVYGVGGCA